MPELLAKMPRRVQELFLEDVGLSVRCCRTLKHAGVANMGDLRNAPEELLAEFVEELKAALRRAKGRMRQYAEHQ